MAYQYGYPKPRPNVGGAAGELIQFRDWLSELDFTNEKAKELKAIIVDAIDELMADEYPGVKKSLDLFEELGRRAEELASQEKITYHQAVAKILKEDKALFRKLRGRE